MTTNGKLYESHRDGNWYVARVRTNPDGTRIAENIRVMDVHECASNFTHRAEIARARAIERGLIEGDAA